MFLGKKHGERGAFRLAVDARNNFVEAMDDTPFVNHPLAKEFCMRQAAENARIDEGSKPGTPPTKED